MKHLLAQVINVGGRQIEGPLNLNNGKLPTDYTVTDVVGKITEFLFPLAATILFLVLLWGGFDYLMAQGSPDKVKSAQAKITAGLIGFILLVSSYVLVRIISSIFGLGNNLF